MDSLDGSKTIVRIIFEMIRDGNEKTIFENSEILIETERLQLELAYLNGISDSNKQSENFSDYYSRTYLKDIYDALKKSKNGQESVNVPRNDRTMD